MKLEVNRKDGGKTETVTVKLDTLPDSVPDQAAGPATAKKALEPRQAAGPAPKGKAKEEPKEEPKEVKKADKPETGLLKRRNAANDHDYWVYVPENYDPNVVHALVIWLHPVGKGRDQDIKDFALTWEDFCDDHHIIVVAPEAENENGWIASETDAVVQAVREVMNQYTIDRQRVIAHGMGIGGQMAFYLGFTARDLVRGVATTGAVLASPQGERWPISRLRSSSSPAARTRSPRTSRKAPTSWRRQVLRRPPRDRRHGPPVPGRADARGTGPLDRFAGPAVILATNPERKRRDNHWHVGSHPQSQFLANG